MPRRPERFRSFIPAGTSLLNPAVLGPDRGAFASKPGREDRRPTQGDRRLSRACMIEKNLAWSQLGQQYCLNCGRNPGTGIATLSWRRRQKNKRYGRSGDAERLCLNLGNRGSPGEGGGVTVLVNIRKRGAGGGGGGAGWGPHAQGAPTTVRPFALLRGLR